ncbi:MAG TPA: hypothetical protein VEG84_07440, partial [Thermoanaerobaculia bacterium]|nr:hypothetical protein [Thermoanaerobaculia bacterium]
MNALTAFPTSWDGNAYHLPLALRWLQDGSLRLDTQAEWHLALPGNGEIPMMLLLGTGDQRALFFFQLVPLVGLALSTYQLARRLEAGTAASMAATAIVLSVPIVIHQAFSEYVDLFGAAFLVIGLALYFSRTKELSGFQDGLLLLFASLSCGIALGTRLTSTFYVALFALLVLIGEVAARRSGRRSTPIRAAAILVVGLLLPSAFWFGRAYGASGNPLFPLRVAVGSWTVFNGPVTSKSLEDYDPNGLRSPAGLAQYPWREWKDDGGRYTVDSGLGAPF